MNRVRIIVLLALLSAFVTQGSVLAASQGDKRDTGDVKGVFSAGGMKLTITSENDFEEFWGLQIRYCDGTGESAFGRNSYKIQFGGFLNPPGYTFNAPKSMKRVVIFTLPIKGRVSAPRLSETVVQRNCAKAEPLPKLYCSDVQVDRVIHRSWEGTPVSFKSNRYAYLVGVKFPGVDGLAPARVAQAGPNRYVPSVTFQPRDSTWSGTFISQRVPTGDYRKVELVVKDDFGQQAKCMVGALTVLP